jgi:hypothetical protein
LESSGVDRREADRGTGEGSPKCGRDWAELTVTDSDARLAVINAVLAESA